MLPRRNGTRELTTTTHSHPVSLCPYLRVQSDPRTMKHILALGLIREKAQKPGSNGGRDRPSVPKVGGRGLRRWNRETALPPPLLRYRESPRDEAIPITMRQSKYALRLRQPSGVIPVMVKSCTLGPRSLQKREALRYAPRPTIGRNVPCAIFL